MAHSFSTCAIIIRLSDEFLLKTTAAASMANIGRLQALLSPWCGVTGDAMSLFCVRILFATSAAECAALIDCVVKVREREQTDLAHWQVNFNPTFLFR